VKWIIRVVLAVVVLVVAAAAAVSLFFDANQFRPRLETELTQALGREVRVGDLKMALFSGGVSAGDLSVADDPAFSHDPFLRTKSLTVGVDLMALIFSRKLNVMRIAIDQPEIVLISKPTGGWNFSSLGAKSAPSAPPAAAAPPAAPVTPPASSATSSGTSAPIDLSVKLLKISDGRVTIRGSGGPSEFSRVNIELRDFSTAARFPFTFSAQLSGGGEMKLDGTAGPINLSDTSLTPVEANLHVKHFDLAASRLLGGSSGFGGLLAIEGRALSTGEMADVSGKVTAEHLKLARNASPAQRPVEFDFTARHDLRKHTGTLSRGDIHIGKALARLTGTYSLAGDSAQLSMKLAGQSMPVPELAAMLPAVGVKLPTGSSLQGGTAHASLATEGPVDRLVTTGTLGLDNTRLAGFDLGSKIKFVAAVAGIKVGPDTDIQKLSATVRSAPDGTGVQDIAFVAPSIGELSGEGTMSPSDALDFHMAVKLQSSNMMKVVVGRNIPFYVRGTASSPSFQPDVKGMASGELKAVIGKDGAAQSAVGLIQGLLGKKKTTK